MSGFRLKAQVCLWRIPEAVDLTLDETARFFIG
jgi:hypothetical protein